MDYKGNPFYLSDEQIVWVEETYASMTDEEKIGQLFCPVVFDTEEEKLRNLTESRHICGVLYREGPAREIQESHRILQKYSRIPLLTASNLESGGVGSAAEGTYFGREMLAGATGDPKRGYELGKISCAEGAAVGVNWALAPVTDVDRNFRNPILNVRAFGSDADQAIAFSEGYLKGAREEGVAVSIKHFPGDGIDERDQHLLTSVNTLSCDEWEMTYGRIYRKMIGAGAQTFMAGHIALPSFEEKYEGHPVRRIIPATLSKNLLQKLLREELGFNGVITTDATPMVGFASAEERRKAIPLAVENGCDIILFNKDLDEDIRYMTEGYRSGLLSKERLREAVLRILSLKASLHLPEKQKEGTLVPGAEALKILHNEQFAGWARTCADEGVTLVKDTQDLLPVSPAKEKRVLLEILGDYPSNDHVSGYFSGLLKDEGFDVTLYVPEKLSDAADLFGTVEDFRSRYDLVIYLANIETASNKTVARLSWHTLFGLGNNMPWFVCEVPTMFISVGNPYHLLDVPMIRTFINGYCNSDDVLAAIAGKITGKSPFKGKSPVDPFCGRKDLEY